DFIIDPYQIYETRCLGGDAILLIAAILGEEELEDYIVLASTLGLSAVCEVHTETELTKALASGARIIGINNRDLSTFSTDIRTSIGLAKSVPEDKIIVSESGIRTREDIHALMKAGVHAFLIGETLMISPDIGGKLRELLNGA
ncbi:MAG TPA: indole-3-glycerol phosphate synthase TrpC, partial [Syntrophales bacterium]|nr:indole-3-glycerol phosphate synthase TrpC [Syntrophales bacterium]